MRKPNRSWRVDRDLRAAEHSLQLKMWRTREVCPRVINVQGHHAYARAIAEPKSNGEFGRCRCRPFPHLNNIVEEDHRFTTKRIAASLWFRSVEGALQTV